MLPGSSSSSSPPLPPDPPPRELPGRAPGGGGTLAHDRDPITAASAPPVSSHDGTSRSLGGRGELCSDSRQSDPLQLPSGSDRLGNIPEGLGGGALPGELSRRPPPVELIWGAVARMAPMLDGAHGFHVGRLVLAAAVGSFLFFTKSINFSSSVFTNLCS
jgi:hypothetical protein